MEEKIAQKREDWLNRFVEKNAWAIIVAGLAIAGAFWNLSARVTILANKIETYAETANKVLDDHEDRIRLVERESFTSLP